MTAINHVSINCDDLDESIKFYRQYFGMEKIPTPNFGFPVQWLQIGSLQLHLFVRGGAEAPLHHHMGITVDDFETVYEMARRSGILDRSNSGHFLFKLPDGALQLYLRDPSGNLVEVNAKYSDQLRADITEEIVSRSAQMPQQGEALDARLFLDQPMHPTAQFEEA